MTGPHPAHIPRARGGQFPAQAGPAGPDTRAAVSPRSEIMKMNNIADFVLGSASPKAGLAGIENSIGRMNIGSLRSTQDEVNKNITEITDNTKVRQRVQFCLKGKFSKYFPFSRRRTVTGLQLAWTTREPSAVGRARPVRTRRMATTFQRRTVSRLPVRGTFSVFR